jgi:hypothetical protein
MSNNAPDYEDNLVFPPQEVKSQDVLTSSGTRQSDVLIEAIEKADRCFKDAAEANEKLLKIKRILQRKTASYASKIINIHNIVKDL